MKLAPAVERLRAGVLMCGNGRMGQIDLAGHNADEVCLTLASRSTLRFTNSKK